MMLVSILLSPCSAQATLSRDLCHFNYETYMSLYNLSVSRNKNMQRIVWLESDNFKNEQAQTKIDQKIKHLDWRYKGAKSEIKRKEIKDLISSLALQKRTLVHQNIQQSSDLRNALKKDRALSEQLALAMIARDISDRPVQRRRLI